MYAALPAASEVHSDDDGAYRAHAKAISLVYGSSLMPDVINPQYPGLLAMSCFLLWCCSLENRKGQQFGPCLRLTNKVTKYHRGPGQNRRSRNFKKRTYKVIVCIKCSSF